MTENGRSLMQTVKSGHGSNWRVPKLKPGIPGALYFDRCPIEGGGPQNACTLSSAASAFVLNATVIPTGALQFLTLWPATAGVTQPTVSTLNAYDGAITSNMAIAPTSTGSITTATDETQLILDVFGYFAP